MYTKHILYANDLQIYLHCLHTDIQNGLTCISHDINQINEWAAHNSLQLNFGKTRAICVASGRYAGTFEVSNFGRIEWGGVVIPFETSVKTSGVTLLSNLSWAEHVNGVCSRINRGLYQLRVH